MDCAPIWTNLKSFPWAEFRDRVDILTGGYPCQPFSAAGKRLGTEDPRHLWPFIADGIRILRPKLCFFENVEGHISLGLREVIGELESIGYQTAWGIFSASEVGAPHQRKRVFILAYDKSQRIQGHWADWLQESRPHAGQGLPLRGGDAGCLANSNDQHGHGEERGGSPEEDRISSEHREEEHSRRELRRADAAGGKGCGELADSSIGRCDWQHAGSRSDVGQWETPQDIRPEATHPSCCGATQVWPSRPGQPQHGWEPPRVVANGHRPHSRHGEQRPERELGDLSGGCGEGVGDAESRQDHGRESRDMGGEAGQGRCGDHAADGAGEGVGNADHGRLASGIDAGSGTEADRGGQSDIEQAEPRQIEPALGRNAPRRLHGVDLAELSGLSHQELAEICEWMVRSDNRTDELRLLGNGVVPATAERAFRTLWEELK